MFHHFELSEHIFCPFPVNAVAEGFLWILIGSMCPSALLVYNLLLSAHCEAHSMFFIKPSCPSSPHFVLRMRSCPLSRISRRCICRFTGLFTSSWWMFCSIKPSSPRTRSTSPGPRMRRSSSGSTGLRFGHVSVLHSVTLSLDQRPSNTCLRVLQGGHLRHADVCVRDAGSRAAE